MLPLALMTAIAANTATPPSPPQMARAQTQALVQIIIAAEVRDGQTNAPHQRTVRTDQAGQTQVLLQFE